jgi:hypothetical protein
MFGHIFEYDLVRKYVSLFGTLFNDTYIRRYDSDGQPLQTLKIPISYAPKEKMLARLDQDPNLNKPYAITLPRMAFEITGMYYASTRKLQTVNRQYTTLPAEQNNLKYQYVPVPYDFLFNLYIMVKNAEDGTRILEQILPFFTPDWTATVNLIPEMNFKVDIPLVLQTVNVEDLYEGNYDTRRSLIWTLGFVMKGYVFGPIKKNGIITLANTNFYATPTDVEMGSANTSEKDLMETIVPGQLANGAPTTNSSLTVDRNSILANSTYDYIITKT